MKMSAKAMLRKLERGISEMAMLPAIVMLFARFTQAYLAVCRWYREIPHPLVFNYTYAPKRVNNRSVHHRKFALFPCGDGHGLIT